MSKKIKQNCGWRASRGAVCGLPATQSHCVDRIAARRLMFGGRVAHGMLSVLWALSVCGPRDRRSPVFDTSAPVPSAGPCWRTLVLRSRRWVRWRAAIRAGGRNCATVMFETTNGRFTFDADPVSEDMALVCRELDDAALATAAGRFGVSRFCPEALFAELAGFDLNPAD